LPELNERIGGWRSGAIGRASDLRFIGRGFESWPGTVAQWSRASYLVVYQVVGYYVTGECASCGSLWCRRTPQCRRRTNRRVSGHR